MRPSPQVASPAAASAQEAVVAAPSALEIQHLTKTFGGTRALDDVSLTVLPGEVHGLVGENGSGKSTLVKVLAGYHTPDGGQLSIQGRQVELPLAPGQFRELGLEFVHQDLGLIPSLTVVENLNVGSLIARSRNRWYVSWRSARRAAVETFERYKLDLDPGAKVFELRPVERAMLAIVRAVEAVRPAQAAGSHGVLVLDEPTVFLPRADTEYLFGLIEHIAATGASVVFVSHDIDEVLQVTNRVTVLRNGRNAGTVSTANTNEAELVGLIIGRTLDRFEHHPEADHALHVAVAVESVRGDLVSDASIELHAGEVVGLTGLVGSGFDEIPYLLFGAGHARRGQLTLKGTKRSVESMTPIRAIKDGISLVPADRQREGSVASLPATENMTLQVLNSYFNGFVLNRRRMTADVQELMRQFDVRPDDPRLVYSSFSGGNQQKALLAKWLQTQPTLLLLHEPTQGVDIGARQTIFKLIRDAAATGTCVLCASSDYDQLASLCDRVLIFVEGRIARELTGEQMTKERIAEQCYNATQAMTGAIQGEE